MARMHSRKKGKSGSTRPVSKIKPEWVKQSTEEIHELVVKLFKEGNPISKIGVILRDQYAVPSVKACTGKSVSQILKGEKLLPAWPEDLMNLFKKSVKLRKHLETNESDRHNTRTLTLVESKIRRLVSYYKNTGVVPKDWYYKPEEVALLIKE